MGIFRFFLNRQKEYVETEIGFGRCDVASDSEAFDLSEASARVPTAAIELLRKVLRFIDSITCPL
jgi:hypothetical protein